MLEKRQYEAFLKGQRSRLVLPHILCVYPSAIYIIASLQLKNIDLITAQQIRRRSVSAHYPHKPHILDNATVKSRSIHTTPSERTSPAYKVHINPSPKWLVSH